MEPTRILGIDSEEEGIVGALPASTVLSNNGFVITKPLGQGGFGITYLARDLTLERDVVIKECFPEAICGRRDKDVVVRSGSNAPHFRKCVEMFMREARSIARLNHPNILHVHAIFEENETAYMVLDLIDGHDLLDIIESPDLALTPPQTRALTVKVLEALSVVHDQNLLHRDIAPDNILVDKMGQPTLIDFGSAREFASERIRQKTALLFVKDGYSPFEFYVSGAAHSPSSDLYALGGTIYHAIVGEAPPSSQARQVEIQAGNGDPYEPLAGRITGYDDAFLEAIDKSLELQPIQRLQSAKAWLTLINQEQDSRTPVAPRSQGPVPEDLGNLISETNKLVLDEAPTMPKAPATELPAPDVVTSRPIWRDEFNQETEEILAFEEAVAAAQATDAETQLDSAETQGRSGFFAKLRGVFAKETLTEEEDLNALLLEAHLRKQRERRKRRASGIGSHRVEFFLAGAVCALGLALWAITKESSQSDGGWLNSVVNERVCDGGDGSLWSFLPNSCKGQEVRRLNLEDRSGIRQIDN